MAVPGGSQCLLAPDNYCHAWLHLRGAMFSDSSRENENPNFCGNVLILYIPDLSKATQPRFSFGQQASSLLHLVPSPALFCISVPSLLPGGHFHDLSSSTPLPHGSSPSPRCWNNRMASHLLRLWPLSSEFLTSPQKCTLTGKKSRVTYPCFNGSLLVLPTESLV